MKIGFDLDRVFINYPPLIPAKLIDWLYRDYTKENLSYRIPTSKLEQGIRKLTHFPFLRPPIPQNVNFLNHFPNNPHTHTLYLISSRYQFLEKLTYQILKKYHLGQSFKSIFLNTKNEQPHIFKERTVKQLQLDLYIDDDLELLKHLYKHCPKTKLFWYNPYGRRRLHNGIVQVKYLSEIENYLQ